MTTEAKSVTDMTAVWAEYIPLREKMEWHADRNKEPEPDLASRWSVLRNRLVNHYYLVLKRVAHAVSLRIVEVEEETLASMGVDGLYDAVDKYDPNRVDEKTGRRIKFETYAPPRIKGSIIDAIRREDWVPRLVRASLKKLEKKRDAFITSRGRMPTEEEMAAEMDMPLDKYQKFAESSKLKLVKSIHASCNRGDSGNGDDETTVGDLLEDVTAFEPMEHVKRGEILAKLFGRGFTPLERTIIHSYYFGGLNMADIGRVLKISESRISQMHSEIIRRLKDKVSRNPEFFGKPLLELLEPAQ